MLDLAAWQYGNLDDAKPPIPITKNRVVNQLRVQKLHQARSCPRYNTPNIKKVVPHIFMHFSQQHILKTPPD